MDIPPDFLQRYSSLPAKERRAIVAAINTALRRNPEAAAKAADYLEGFLEKPKASICPIFREYRNTVEQFGSGVLLDILGAKFLLTVSHVTDLHETSPLVIPGKKQLISISGYLADMRMPASGNRDDDRYDIAYYRLDQDCINEIHDELTFLKISDCDLYDTTSEGDGYTIIGYPSRRSETVGLSAKTKLLSLSGEGVTDHRYELSKRNIQHHILIQYRRNHAVHYRTFTKSLVCLPEGMSGGGVFAWHKELQNPKFVAQPKLVGIVTDYDQGNDAFIATRLNCFIRCIIKNNPDLPISVAAPFDHKGPLRRKSDKPARRDQFA